MTVYSRAANREPLLSQYYLYRCCLKLLRQPDDPLAEVQGVHLTYKWGEMGFHVRPRKRPVSATDTVSQLDNKSSLLGLSRTVTV